MKLKWLEGWSRCPSARLRLQPQHGWKEERKKGRKEGRKERQGMGEREREREKGKKFKKNW
jgi:prophage tail gpP-like protein